MTSPVPSAAWEQRLAALWNELDATPRAAFHARMDALAGELGATHPVGLFERGGARDSTGAEAEAVALYRAALAGGLDGSRRRQAVIQLASTLRNLGETAEAIALLEAELARGSDELDGAVRAFLGLALTSAGREREAVAVLLTALSGYLPRYRRSTTAYAQALLAENPPSARPG